MEKQIKRIDGEQRYYEVEGVGKLPSVTTILGVIGKPALMNWKVKVVIEYLQAQPNSSFAKDTILEVLAKAKSKPKELMEEALNIGSEVHQILEFLVNKEIADKDVKWDKNIISWGSLKTEVHKCLSAFYKWVEEVDFKPLESELTVYSKKLGFAGTLDAIGYVNGKLAVIDYKSSKAFYPEMGLQLSAYKYAYREMSKKAIPEMWVLRLGKEDGEFEAVKVNDYRKNITAFLGAYEIWKWKNPKHKK